jgi:hypothetical protein
VAVVVDVVAVAEVVEDVVVVAVVVVDVVLIANRCYCRQNIHKKYRVFNNPVFQFVFYYDENLI